MGPAVTAEAGAKGLAAIADPGADVLVDYRLSPQPDFGAPFDAVLKASGHLPFARAQMLMTSSGRFIESSPTIPLFIGANFANLFRRRKHLPLAAAPKTADLRLIARMVGDGRIKPLIARTYRLPDAAKGFAELEGGGTIGKIAIVI